jgi:pyridoxamine 5'-phosphate oxidase
MTDPRPKPSHAEDLAAVRAAAFALLARGVADRRSPLHTPTLASIGLDGMPRARTLVLRGFDAATRIIRLHSDCRSDKFAELARNPGCALHGYDAAAQIQLRLEGSATLHTDDTVAEAGWQASRPFSRIVYSAEPAPGTAIAAPIPAPQDEVTGRAQFGIDLYHSQRLYWLRL